MAGALTNKPKARGSRLLNVITCPRTSDTLAPASRAIRQAAATSHSCPQRNVANRSASPAAIIAIRRAMELGFATGSNNRSTLAKPSLGKRAPFSSRRLETDSRSPLRNAPRPALASQFSSRAGACSQPRSGRPSLTRATDMHQPLRPRRKSRVPSIGSTIQTRPPSSRAGSSSVSSDSQPAEGSNAINSRFRNRSSARSASQTGLPGAFSHLSTSLPPPGQRSIAMRPASRRMCSRREVSIMVGGQVIMRGTLFKRGALCLRRGLKARASVPAKSDNSIRSDFAT